MCIETTVNNVKTEQQWKISIAESSLASNDQIDPYVGQSVRV